MLGSPVASDFCCRAFLCISKLFCNFARKVMSHEEEVDS